MEGNGDKGDWSQEQTGAHEKAVGTRTWRKRGDRHGRTQKRGHHRQGVGVGTRTLRLLRGEEEAGT